MVRYSRLEVEEAQLEPQQISQLLLEMTEEQQIVIQLAEAEQVEQPTEGQVQMVLLGTWEKVEGVVQVEMLIQVGMVEMVVRQAEAEAEAEFKPITQLLNLEGMEEMGLGER